jgi:sporulation protein YlmC with PRC-barrel domain
MCAPGESLIREYRTNDLPAREAHVRQTEPVARMIRRAGGAGKENAMKTMHELLGAPLVTLDEGIRLGTLKGVEFDNADGQIRYLHIDGAETRADGVVPWGAVRAVGADAITVESVGAVLEAIPGADREACTADVRDRPVITESGTRLGKVTEYDVDETTGRIERYHVGTGGLIGRLTHREHAFDRSAVRAFGRDAIIVVDAVGQSGAPDGAHASKSDGRGP